MSHDNPPIEYPADMDHRERLRMAEAEIVRLRAELAKEALQREGYIGPLPDGLRMSLVVEDDRSAGLVITRWVGEGDERHVESWLISPEEALRLLLLGNGIDEAGQGKTP
jgi:hypothetical protein